MNSSGSHFDHSLAYSHLVPLLTTLLSQVWNSTSNTRRRNKEVWVAKRDPGQPTESVERDSEQMRQYIVYIVMLSQSWWFDEFTFGCKLLYDDAVLYHSQKIFNIIMGYDVHGHFFNVKAPGLASLALWCSNIDRIRSRSADYEKARRKLHEHVESRMDRDKCDAMCSYETQRKRFIANYLRSNLGDRNMAHYLIMHGAPWLLQADNQKTKRALELPTADKTKIYHLGVNFLRWWGRAMHALNNYSNSYEVTCARVASSSQRSERDKTNIRRAKQLQRALQRGTLQYRELSVAQRKLLPLALPQENHARNRKFDTTQKISLLYNFSTPWTPALASTLASEEFARAAEDQTTTRTSCPTGDDHIMPTLYPPPGLSQQSSAERSLPAALSPRSLQESNTQ